MTYRALAAVVVLAVLGTSASSCSDVPSNARIGIAAPNSSEKAFGPVGDLLVHRCGSLDCHGQIGRNFRIWGCEGLRLSAGDASICNVQMGGRKTTPEEHQATFRSLVALEPAVMTEVVGNHGQDPELLTFIRKARGTESHKGGTLFTAGDVQDVCVTSWLSGQTNITACNKAFAFPAFPPLPGP